MIDLHSHTTASDGTYSPQQLVEHAAATRLEALAITDHDTFTGYDQAVPHALARDLDLVCGIELSCKYFGKSVHLLGYFLAGDPRANFRNWILSMQASRHDRNKALIKNLQRAGLNVTLEEWYERGGTLPGRPHLAAILLEKGYVKTRQEAFDKYLAEGTESYAARVEPDLVESIGKIKEAGGLSVLAHPVRVARDPGALGKTIRGMAASGLQGIEVYHSESSPSEQAMLASLAKELGLAVTGGSDFHGGNKPSICLGSGLNGNIAIPRQVLDDLRAAVAR